MVGKYHETTFDPDSYDQFYEHHQFEPTPDSIALSVHEVIPRFSWAFDKVEELAPKELLDLGCLDGAFILTVAKQLGIKVSGIDLTKDGIDIARRRAKENDLDATLYQGRIESWLSTLAAEGKKYDLITMFEVIEHVEDVQEILKLIDGVLKPGGHVLVSTPAFESPVFGKDDEKNKCHIRLYTAKPEDYEDVNKYGNVRKATSIWKEIGKDRILSVDMHNELLHTIYQ